MNKYQILWKYWNNDYQEYQYDTLIVNCENEKQAVSIALQSGKCGELVDIVKLDN